MAERALISWIAESKGGRTSPPAGPTFRAVARFADDLTWPAESWSLAIRRTDSLMRDRFWIADVQWLADDGPDVIRPGARFELYEGRRIVAHGLVIETNRPIPVARAARRMVPA